jgi:PhzF family phenazine biosynthesis protein
MALTLWQVDAFTDQPFAGNPAGVCVLERPAPDDWMRSVAAEMNLSETAFLHPSDEDWRLRWFTPAAEVDLCGHATLASAHVLWSEGLAEEGRAVRFQTRSGPLTAVQASGGWIEMDFPRTPVESAEAPAGLLDALGLETTPPFVGRSRFDYLVETAEARRVRRLEPDFRRLKSVDCRGVIVTARADRPDLDFISRFFAPAVGVDEDPVTGSAHAALGPYWADRLGREALTAEQVSRRGGRLRLTVGDDRLIIAGRAVTVFKADLYHGPA